MRAEENAREADSQGGMYSNFRDVWFDNTTPDLNGCSFNSFAGRGPINRLVLSPDYLARKLPPPGQIFFSSFSAVSFFVLGEVLSKSGVFEYFPLDYKSWSICINRR